jgi:hypothetical protein
VLQFGIFDIPDGHAKLYVCLVRSRLFEDLDSSCFFSPRNIFLLQLNHPWPLVYHRGVPPSKCLNIIYCDVKELT